MQISHIKYVAMNTRELVDAGKLNENDTQVQLMLAGNQRMRVKTLEKNLRGTGITVAEIMLRPGVETEWYREASAAYIATNLKIFREAWEFSQAKLAWLCGIAQTSIKNYESGSMPGLARLQILADVLEVEVADLMLPLEGSEQIEKDR
nr:MAG TPA: helix-turn-helix domain protein [Caudoviricetes sp.]